MCFEYDFSALFIVAAYCLSNSMLQILHSETNFLETNFLNKLILQFLINNLYKHSSQGSRLSEKKKRFFLVQRLPIFCLKLCYRHYTTRHQCSL